MFLIGLFCQLLFNDCCLYLCVSVHLSVFSVDYTELLKRKKKSCVTFVWMTVPSRHAVLWGEEKSNFVQCRWADSFQVLILPLILSSGNVSESDTCVGSHCQVFCFKLYWIFYKSYAENHEMEQSFVYIFFYF